MAQDIIADALNTIMNVKRLEKKEITIKRISNLLIRVLDLMKKEGLIDYEICGDEKKKELKIKILKLNECKAIKPRYNVCVDEIEKYIRRFLPSRNIGKLIISTSKGLKSHDEALKERIGGCLIAYYY